jgi:hypothetical protein
MRSLRDVFISRSALKGKNTYITLTQTHIVCVQCGVCVFFNSLTCDVLHVAPFSNSSMVIVLRYNAGYNGRCNSVKNKVDLIGFKYFICTSW